MSTVIEVQQSTYEGVYFQFCYSFAAFIGFKGKLPQRSISRISFYLKNNCFPKHATTLTVSEVNIKKGEWFLVCKLKISYMIKVMTSYIVFFFSKTITSPSFNFIPKEFEILGGCTRGMSLLRIVYVKRALHTKGSQLHLLAQS